VAEVLEGVAGIDGDELKDAGVAVAIDHATGATVTDNFELLKSRILQMGVSQ
jgi:hypothetical protein